MQAKEHKLLDRAAMIEAASRSLRQQMRARDRPRSKGSLHDMGDPGAWGAGPFHDSPEKETSQRRIHSAENKHRMVQRDGAEQNQSASTSALESYPAEEEPVQTVTSPSGPDLDELKRPLSRKKVPSASAAAGLGACSDPVKMLGAFEQRKTRQPIPLESWGPRPPSRNRLPPKARLLDVSLVASPVACEERVEVKTIATPSRSRSEPGRESRPGSKAGNESVVGSTKWAAARYPGPLPLGGSHHSAQVLSEPRRGRKAKDWGSPGSPEDLGTLWVSGVTGTRSGSGQQLTSKLSDVFDHHGSDWLVQGGELKKQMSDPSLSGSWAAHVDTSGALEVSGSACGEVHKDLWGRSVSSVGPIALRKSRHPEAVSVEDVESGAATPTSLRAQPQVITRRSSAQKKDRGDVRRGIDDRRMRGRTNSLPFGTSLDVDFLSLFAS